MTWWAETQLGVSDFSGYCYAFVFDCWLFGADYNIGAAPTALDKWNSLPSSAKHGGTPPQGAIGFWTSADGDGHAALSAGNGYFVSSWYGSSTHTISWVTLQTISANVGGHYLGWWLPA